jgi:hypothetical protein
MLPSLREFDEQVEALKISEASACPRFHHQSPPYNRSKDQAVLGISRPTTQPVQSIACRNTPAETPVSTDQSPITKVTTSPTYYRSLVRYYRKARRSRCVKNTGIHFINTFNTPSESSLPYSGYPSKRPIIFKRQHVNQRYSREERDYIVSSCSDKRMTWKHIKRGFDALFGTNPERTIQGLQAWYYRKVKETSDLNCEKGAGPTSTKVRA